MNLMNEDNEVTLNPVVYRCSLAGSLCPEMYWRENYPELTWLMSSWSSLVDGNDKSVKNISIKAWDRSVNTFTTKYPPRWKIYFTDAIIVIIRELGMAVLDLFYKFQGRLKCSNPLEIFIRSDPWPCFLST